MTDEVEFALLKAELEGCKMAITGLAMCLMRLGVAPADEIVKSLGAVAEFSRQTTGPGAEIPIMHIIDILQACEGTQHPEAGLLASALLHADAGPSLQSPLSTWLQQAHPDEISGEILRLLRQGLQRDAQPDSGGDDSEDG